MVGIDDWLSTTKSSFLPLRATLFFSTLRRLAL